jgi:hypothetical protein
MVIYDAQDGTMLIEELREMQTKGNSVIKPQGQKASPTATIGSTQNVGSSVKGGRWPMLEHNRDA